MVSSPFRYCLASRMMVRRIQSRNQGVCDTMSATATSATASVPIQATTWTRRRIRAMRSERLTDAEMDPHRPRLRLAVHEQTRNRVELPAGVEPNGPIGVL